MNKKQVILIVFGIIISLLGLLWFLQGSDIVHLKPILCFVDCQPMVGKSLQWQTTGAVTFIVGVLILYKHLKRRGHN